MIVPMRHVTLLCLASARERALEALARLGVVHLRSEAGTVLQAEAVKRERTRLTRAEAALSEVDLVAQESGHEARRHARDVPAAGDLDAIVETAETLNRLLRQAEALRLSLAQWTPFGHFDPAALQRLVRSGVDVRLFRCDAETCPTSPEAAAVHLLHRDDGHVWGAWIGPGDLPAGCVPVALPDRPTAKIEAEYQALRAEIQAARDRLLAARRHLPELQAALLAQQERIDAAEALAGMGCEGEIAWLTGFCPTESQETLRECAARQGWGLVFRAPKPNEAVPTLVRRPRWLMPVKAVFDVLGIQPGYREADISGMFLVFFTIFFALLVGDAGYGLIILGGTLLARRKLPQVPRYPFRLLTLLGVATLFWGALTGNYFGIDPEVLPGFLQPRGHLLWLQTRENLMQLCFLIGAVHLTLAHLWNGLLLWPSRKALAQAGWILLVWSMYYTACGMVLQTGFPALLPWGFGLGLLLVVLFMTDRAEFRDKWIDHAMLPLSLASCLVDVISYIRLYAVGVATLQVAESFNNMALSFDLPLPLRLPLVALVLLLGHSLNLVLAALSILVHAVRLNTLEFSQHKGLEWAGFAYQPFRKRNGKQAETLAPTASIEPL